MDNFERTESGNLTNEGIRQYLQAKFNRVTKIKDKQIKELEIKNTLQRNALTWIIEEASSDIYNQSEILKVAEQALKSTA